MQKKITKAVITAAGFGTRFLPATKNVAKELIPIINKPIIHYIVESCIAAGIKDIIIVTKFGNHSVEDYFDTAPVLENYLEKKGKLKELEEIKKIYTGANFIFVRQDASLPYGNGSPLYSARHLLKDEPFVFTFGDDFVLPSPGQKTEIEQLVNFYNENPAKVVMSCVEVNDSKLRTKLGIAEVNNKEDWTVTRFIEKPKPEQTESNLASVSSYVLSTEVIDNLDPKKVNEATGEFLFQDGFADMIVKGDAKAFPIKGKFLTNGDPLNFLKATVEMALYRDDLRDDFLGWLKERIDSKI